MTMTPATPIYLPATCNDLSTAQGGYPDLVALPASLTSKCHLVPQIDTADRAFVCHGMHHNGAHFGGDGEDHPLLLSFKKENPRVSGECIWKDFLVLLRQDLYDAVCVLVPVLKLLITNLKFIYSGRCNGPALWRSNAHLANQ